MQVCEFKKVMCRTVVKQNKSDCCHVPLAAKLHHVSGKKRVGRKYSRHNFNE